LFYAGLALALWRIKKAPYALAVIWLFALVLPSVLSPNNPSQHRSVAAIGAAYIFPALALGAIGEWTRARWGSAPRWNNIGRVGFTIVAVALVLLAAYEGVRDYFLVWSENPEVRMIYRADLAGAARWLDENEKGERVMLSAEFANDLDRGSFNLEATRPHAAHFFSGTDTFVIPDAPSALYINPHSGAIADEWRKKFLSSLTPIYAIPNELEIFRATASDLQKWRAEFSATSIAATTDSNITIRAASFPDRVQAGGKLRLLMAWQINTPKVTDADNLTWTIRLMDSKGYVWSEAAGLGYTPSQWLPNDLIISAFDFDIPVDTPPLALSSRVALSSKAGDIPLQSETHPSEFGGVTLGRISVERGPVPTAKPDLPIRYPSKAQFGSAIQLTGSDAVGEVAAGEAWRLVLFWKANTVIQNDYMLRLVALTDDGKEIARKDETLLAPEYPTSKWRAGEYLRSVHDLMIPPDAPRGKAVVRLFLLDAQSKPVGRADGVPIAGIDISGRAHDFTQPQPAHPLSLRFADNIELIGYDLIPPQPRWGEPLTVTLYWHARAATEKPLTVFAHLLNGDGKLIAQHDAPPLSGDAPTDTWVAGEYLTDTYKLTLPKDEQGSIASIEIGLYDSQTAVRLPVFDANGAPLGDRLLIENINVLR
jgi:hypothetical protein